MDQGTGTLAPPQIYTFWRGNSQGAGGRPWMRAVLSMEACHWLDDAKEYASACLAKPRPSSGGVPAGDGNHLIRDALREPLLPAASEAS